MDPLEAEVRRIKYGYHRKYGNKEEIHPELTDDDVKDVYPYQISGIEFDGYDPTIPSFATRNL